MLVSSKQMILEAKKGGYAIGAFNTSDLEITRAIIKAATAQNSPVIISTSEKAIEYAGLATLALIVTEEASQARVPVAFHLDHGKTIATVEKCIRAGYTSVMFDGSSLSIEENELKTRHAVELAHHADIPCEGELGHLGKAGGNSGDLTNPADVPDFIARSGVDFLAVSIGSKHGNLGEGSEKIDIALLKEIAAKTATPLVLHGASGVSSEDIKKAIAAGISKVNIDTDIRQKFAESLRQVMADDPKADDPRDILTFAMAEIQKLVEAKIKLFGSNNKA